MGLILPKYLKYTEAPNTEVYQIKINKDLPYFKGHFPAQAILPGFIQIAWVLNFAKDRYKIDLSSFQIKRVKFIKPMLPEMECKLTIFWGSNNLKFKYQYQELDFSIGSISF